MNFKTALTTLLIALLALVGTAGAAEVVYDFSGIPDSPVAGTQYAVPVTVVGSDVAGYEFKVNYNADSADISFDDTGDATTGGRPGKFGLNGVIIPPTDGSPANIPPAGFTLLITPLSDVTITINSNIQLTDKTNVAKTNVLEFQFSTAPTSSPTPTVEPTPTSKPTVEPSPVVGPTPTAKPTSEPTPTVNPTVDPASGSVNLLPTGGKIDWYTENIRVINGKAYIQVVMTGADRVAGITVNLKNVSGANVALNRTGSALFKSGSSTKLNYYSANGFTNNDTVLLYTIDITNISEGVPVSFDLEYGVTDTGKRDVTLDYPESNPVSVSFTAGEAEEPTVEPTEESPETFTVTYSGSDYVPDAVIVEAGAEYIVSDDRAVSPGRIFRGWTAGSEEYAAGDKMIVTGNVTLTAEWYTPAINPTGANVVDLYKVLHGEDPDQYPDYDMNGDGHVNIIDLVLMAQYVADSVAVLPEDKITWDTSSVIFENGRASIPVIMTDADRIQGMRVSVKNVSNANVTLNGTGSPIFRESGSVIVYFTPAAGYTNEGAAQIFSIDITDAAIGSDVMFTLNFEVTSNGKDVTSSYVTTPAGVKITVGK